MTLILIYYYLLSDLTGTNKIHNEVKTFLKNLLTSANLNVIIIYVADTTSDDEMIFEN